MSSSSSNQRSVVVQDQPPRGVEIYPPARCRIYLWLETRLASTLSWKTCLAVLFINVKFHFAFWHPPPFPTKPTPSHFRPGPGLNELNMKVFRGNLRRDAGFCAAMPGAFGANDRRSTVWLLLQRCLQVVTTPAECGVSLAYPSHPAWLTTSFPAHRKSGRHFESIPNSTLSTNCPLSAVSNPGRLRLYRN